MDFLSLSLDVIRLILDHLCQGSLRAICLTNSHLYQIAEPVLYSRIQLPLRGKSSEPPRIPLLLRTLLARPELASYIREISIGKSTSSGPWSPMYSDGCRQSFNYPGGASELEAICGFVEKLKGSGFSYPRYWIYDLRRGHIGAFLAVLLLNLPVVTVLHVEEVLFHRNKHLMDHIVTHRNNRHVDHVLRSLLCDQKCSIDSLQNLRSLTMYRQASTSSQLLLFYLPYMNQISVIFEDAIFLVDLGAATREFRWPNNSPPPPSNLKILEVEKIHERHLGHLLSVTPSLRSLTWTRPYYVGKLSETGGSSAVYPAIFSLDDIMSSLTLVRDTLTELRLRAVDRTGPRRWGARRPDVRSLSLARFADSATSLSLAQFENLRILEIPNVFIMGNIPYESAGSFLQRPILQTNLPPRLEELTLTGKLAPIFISHCEFDSRQDIPYLDQILSWLEDPEFSNSCHLRKLGYYNNWTDEELREESAEDHLRKRHILMDITLKAGIDFVFEYPPPSQDMEALGEI